MPFLLKHGLREYQHIGLDWLATIYDQKLNGILADEMGLGKTIQTISLLAHLACEKGIWGPHLIVVPTSVMLNWEMEFKKWCPAFKMLTYFGSAKERKAKRMGWSKPNSFHVCVTTYTLILQVRIPLPRPSIRPSRGPPDVAVAACLRRRARARCARMLCERQSLRSGTGVYCDHATQGFLASWDESRARCLARLTGFTKA